MIRTIIQAGIMLLGPGIKPSDVRTLEYLREIAIQTAKGLADGTVKKQPRKRSMVDKVRCCLVVAVHFGL